MHPASAQVLRRIDKGESVDIRGIPDKALLTAINTLFHNLCLRRTSKVSFVHPLSYTRVTVYNALTQCLTHAMRQKAHIPTTLYHNHNTMAWHRASMHRRLTTSQR